MGKYIIGAVIGVALLFGYQALVGSGTDIPFGYSGGPNVFDTVTSGATTTCVSCASTEVLARNPDRQYAFITNNSSNVIWLAFSTTTANVQAIALPNSGIRLAANGTYEIEAENLFTGAITATSTTAGGGDSIIFIEK